MRPLTPTGAVSIGLRGTMMCRSIAISVPPASMALQMSVPSSETIEAGAQHRRPVTIIVSEKSCRIHKRPELAK